MDCSLPGFSIHGIFKARVLEWGAIAFSKKTEEICSKSQRQEVAEPAGELEDLEEAEPVEDLEEVDLKLNIQKTKIMASCPITSWEVDGETVSDFIFWAPKSL